MPVERQSTKAARAALPVDVPLAVAAANGGRAARTFSGLAGLLPLRATDMVDALHEPSRLRLMPTSGALVTALRDADLPCALSGAGPSVLAILPAADDHALDRVHIIVAGAAAPDAVEVIPCAWDLSGALACPPLTQSGVRRD